MRSRSWPRLPPPVLAATAGAAAVLVAAVAGLAVLGDPARRLPASLGLLALAGCAWVAACLLLERAATAGRRSSAAAILAVALLLRLPLLALPPTLSDDVLRYLWDGRVAASGTAPSALAPYLLAPDAAELAPLRDDVWQRLPHRQVPTVYPPLALAAFSIAAALPRPILAWKGLLTALDLAACALLIALARRRGLPAARAAWYAWSPLVALEVAGMGHVDALGVAAAVAAVLALSPKSAGADRQGDRDGGAEAMEGGGAVDAGRDEGSVPRAALPPRADGPAAAEERLPSRAAVLLAAAAAAAGALAKLAPLAALPLWARASRRPWLFAGAAVALAAAGLAPVVLAVGGVPPGLVAYGVSWEFAGPLYEPLWRLLDAAAADRAAAALVARAERATGWYRDLDRLYPFLYPQLLAKLLLAAGAAAVVLRSLRDRQPVAGSRRLFGGLLICSATVYPWYLLWVLPWAALDRHAPWLLAAALAPLLYLPQLSSGGAFDVFPGVWAAVWGPPALLAAGGWWRARARRSALEGRGRG